MDIIYIYIYVDILLNGEVRTSWSFLASKLIKVYFP